MTTVPIETVTSHHPPGAGPVPLPVAEVDALAVALVGIGSVSGAEDRIADAVAAALVPLPHLEVVRDGNCVLARTALGRDRRVVVAGHLDTVPQPAGGPLLPRVDGDVLWGRGAADMLGGVAVALHLAATITEPAVDTTYLFYDNEEVAAERNGLTRLATTRRDWLQGDVAVLGEPTGLHLEGGCQGSLTVDVTVRGRAGHAARAWLADNAIHAAAAVIRAVADHQARQPVVDGLRYREGLQVVGIGHGGNAGNVVPDVCRVTINHRFAPDHDVTAALATVREVLADGGFAGDEADIQIRDAAIGARPGLDSPALAGLAAAVSAATGAQPTAKLGWTDVARFAALGIPAVNFGPGDPGLAHADDERVPLEQVREAADILGGWLRHG